MDPKHYGARTATLTTLSSEFLSDSGAVRAVLQNCGGKGWVCLTDRVLVYDGGPIEGIPLCAELSIGERESATLRQDGQGWLWTRLVERDGDDHRWFEERYASTVPGDEQRRHHVYRVYWRKNSEGNGDGALDVWRPYAARFCGWQFDGSTP